MKNKKLSVIVLCRNMKEYLSQCIDSVLMQQYDNMEIILINDSTIDPACEVMAYYCSKHPECITMDVVDSDLLPGGARNRGLSLTKGEFVTFVDGDDWLNREMYNAMMHYFNDGEVDMVACDYNEVFMESKETISRQICSLPEGVFLPINTGDMFKNESYSWNTIFRRSLLDGIGFSFFEKTIYDDLAVHLPFAKSRKVAYVPRPLYQHRKHIDEITTHAGSEQHLVIVELVAQLANEFNEKVDMSVWKDKFNELLILYLFYYVHYLMFRGSVDMDADILKLCAETFIKCGGWLPEEIKRYDLLELQLKSPVDALAVLKQMKKNGAEAFVK